MTLDFYSHATALTQSEDKFKFNFKTRVNGCNQQNFNNLFLSDYNKSRRFTFDIQSVKPDRYSDHLKLY